MTKHAPKAFQNPARHGAPLEAEMHPRGAKNQPRDAQEGPRRAQKAPKRTQETPKSAQKLAKSCPRRPQTLKNMGKNAWFLLFLKGRPGAIRARFGATARRLWPPTRRFGRVASARAEGFEIEIRDRSRSRKVPAATKPAASWECD